MAEIKLETQSREISTKGAINKKRREGFVPGIYYSKGSEPIHFFVPEISLNPIVYTTEMNIVNLVVDGKSEHRGIVKEIQFDPLTDHIIHIDLQGITVGETIQMPVPISIVGQAIGVREGGRLQQSLHKVDVECLPKDIPQNIEIDISELNIGDVILVRDISMENIKILNSEDAMIISVVAPRAEEEVTEEEAETLEAATEPEVISKSKSEEEA